jgi:hypothetical protein
MLANPIHNSNPDPRLAPIPVPDPILNLIYAPIPASILAPTPELVPDPIPIPIPDPIPNSVPIPDYFYDHIPTL